MADYKISGERLTAIADQVRRISGVTDELTPEQMETNLLNVTVSAELPDAEEAIFGVSAGDTETGILTEGISQSGGTLSSAITSGWKFTAAEAFSIIGFRVKDNKAAYRKINLWDSSGNIVVSVEKNDMASDWVSYYLDSPINVAIDETYTITTYHYIPDFIRVDSTSFNPKLKNIEVRQANTDSFPTSSNYYFYMALVDIIIAPVQAELPDSYEIQRTTMDDIAEEVQRITGATTKLTTAQILTALQGIQLQSKTVTPTDTEQTITPDDGYYGLSSVVVGASAGEILEDLSEVAF